MKEKKTYYKEALQAEVFDYIRQAAAALKLDTYVVGGYVRDFLLDRNLKKDIDIVAVGDGIELAEKVSSLMPHRPKVKVFKNYGTAMLRFWDTEVEFVGARKESYRRESRNPDVSPGSLEDDQLRRDFTINALAISLNEKDYGKLIDPFQGREDLEKNIIRTPRNPDVTFSDDPLRMLRAIRFATQLDFFIQKETLEAIKRNSERVKILSQERIVAELHKIIMTREPSAGFLLLETTGLLQYILPELTALKGVEEIDGERHKDNFYHSLQVLDNISRKTDNLWLRWAALLHDIGKAVTKKFDPKVGWTFHNHEFVGGKMVYKLFKRLHMPLNDKMKFVRKMVSMSSRPISIAGEVTDSAVRRLVFDAGDHIDDLMTLCEADITTRNNRKYRKYMQNFKRVRTKIKEVEERDRIRNFQPPVSGELIMKTFGIGPSREIGVIKEAIKEAILEGEIPNEFEVCYEYMLRKGKELGLKVLPKEE